MYNYKNGNCEVSIFEDGTKIREWPDGEEPKPIYPESMDVKITGYCDNVLCEAWCHEMSNKNGKHGDILNMLPRFAELPNGVELACLEEKTLVATENGFVRIGDLQIGDLVLNEYGKSVKVINVQKSQKECIKIITNKGYSYICTPDHPFLSKLNNVEPSETIKFLKIGNFGNEQKNRILDLSQFVFKRDENKSSSRSGVITDDYIKFNSYGNYISRFLEIDEDMMFLYGIFVAEGSRKGLSLNKNELDIEERVNDILKNKFNLNSKKYTHNNGMQIEFTSAKLIQKLFVEYFQIGSGACNKSIKYLFNQPKRLISSALYGMFLGDGCFRNRKIGKNISYKTCSEILAKELVFLLNTCFEVEANLYEGINKERYIEGRKLGESKYYQIEVYGIDNLKKIFPDVYQNDKFNGQSGKAPISITNKENVGKQNVVDITLESNSSHFFMLEGGVITHNCGGGNPLSHPDLFPFLKELKQMNLISNLTINQYHVTKYRKDIEHILNNQWISGLGLSLIAPKFQNLHWLKDYPNLVFHLILGIHSKETVEKLIEEFPNVKILFLGYKQYGNGEQFYSPEVQKQIDFWQEHLLDYQRKLYVMSFDNLAIKQLKLQEKMPKKMWNEFYMGNDGSFTFFMDLIEKKFCQSSTKSIRYDIGNLSIKDMFNIIRNNNGN